MMDAEWGCGCVVQEIIRLFIDIYDILKPSDIAGMIMDVTFRTVSDSDIAAHINCNSIQVLLFMGR